jgi:DNA-damage-inducible protein J
MAQSVVSVRMDENLKRDFDAICNELGLSMSTVVNVLAKKMTREKRVPFEVSIDPFFSDLNMQALNESIREKEQGKVVVKTMSELDEMANE